MVYVDENRQRYEVQYCVVLRGGKDAGVRQYFSAPKKRIQHIFDGYRFDVDGETFAGLGHIAGNQRGETEDIAKIDKRKDLLEFRCKNEKTANKCAEYWKLGVPFPEAK